MFKDLQLAWRNLWRNRKRTVITISAVILAVFLSTMMSSMQEGTYARMIDNMVKFYSGYIQVHHPGYWESKSINDTYVPDSLLNSALKKDKDIILAVPRLESFTLISSGDITKGCSLIGIDPKGEDSLTHLSRWVVQGRYLTETDNGLLVAVNIARNMGVSVGDTLILMSQGYQGSTASALVPVTGIVQFPSPELNNFAVYISLERAREFFGVPGRVTSMVLMVKDYLQVDRTAGELRSQIQPEYSVKTWNEMQPELVKMIEGDRAGAVVMKGIIYLVVCFGILGTIIMMMAERRKEMGVMIAIGMQKRRLQRILIFESLFMGMLGVVIGVLLSIPVIFYLTVHPIPLPGQMGKVYESFGIEAALYFSHISKIFVNQAITVFVLTLFIALYPLLTVRGLQVIKALRGQ